MESESPAAADAEPIIEGDPPIYRYRSIGSTNTEALRLGEAGAPHQSVVLADYQTAGRGQFERRWHMPAGEGVLMSMLYREMPPGVQFTTLTLQVARAMAELLRDFSGVEIGIKEPNDLIIAGKKVGGILSEARWRGDAMLYAVVGIGINVNVSQFPDEISQTATSLRLASGRELDVADLTGRMIERLRDL